MNTVDLETLTQAKTLLENPGYGMQVANLIGRPLEIGMEKLNSKKLNRAVEISLKKALSTALLTLETTTQEASNNLHKGIVGLSGAVGGFFGMAALAVELPISTTIMLRSIADVARSEGHDLNELQTQLACMEVFALGSTKNSSDDGAETAYYATRASLAYEMHAAMNYLNKMSTEALQKAIEKGEIPIIIKLITAIASRFGITVSEKMMAQAIPLIGSVGGAGINLLFIDHYQQMAKGHFIIKRLEKVYGKDKVRLAYEKIVL